MSYDIIVLMIILGIDPGTATVGVGVIECDGEKVIPLHFGWIKTPKEDSAGKRLAQIHREMRTLIRKHQPDVMAIERLFFFANHKTAMAVSESIGVIKLAAENEKVPTVSLAPLEVKSAVAGNGRADKEAVKKAVRQILKVRSPKNKKTHFDDLCDALAVAICYAKKNLLPKDDSLRYNISKLKSKGKSQKRGYSRKNRSERSKGL